MRIVNWNELAEEQRRQLLTRPAMTGAADITSTVSDIINRIRREGDKALKEYTAAFDRVADGNILLSQEAITAACDRVDSAMKAAIGHAYRNIATFHEAQKSQPLQLETQAGVRCELHTHAIGRVGLYVPGGSAPLVSTVLMLAIPAKIAGCRKVVLCSPPPVADEIVYAATLCGVSEIYTMGGAQAIAAMAYGTESVSKVDKIFGPGNAWVTEAKRQVSMDFRGAAIDMPAGPSEVLVIADETANPAFIAADLLSQAEHGPDSQVVLVTPSRAIADGVDAELTTQLAQLSRAEIAKKALASSLTIVCENLPQACLISNEYAPEHLIVQTQEPRALLPRLENAGSIFLGDWTPESVGDYASGTNHTLPTHHYALAYNGVNLDSYQRKVTFQHLTEEGIKSIGSAVVCMAENEQLEAHANAMRLRCNKLGV